MDLKVQAPKTWTPPIKTYERGIPFTDKLVKTVTPPKYSPTYYQDRSKIGGQTWGEQARKDVYGGTGIMGMLKKIAPFFLPALLPAKLGQLYSGYNQLMAASRYAKQLGLTKTNLMSDLTSNIGRKQGWSGIESTVGGGDGQGQVQAPANVIEAGMKQFQPTQSQQDQMTEIMRKRLILQGHADKGALNERGRSTLAQMNQMISQYQAEPRSIYG